MKKRVVARKDLVDGQVLTYEDLDLLRIESPSDLWSLESVVGRTLLRAVQKHNVLQSDDLSDKPGALKRVVAVLLCRSKSTRLYAKPLQLVGDKTILEHLISQIQMVSRIDDIILAISEKAENAAFVNIAERWGLDYVLGDEEDGLDRMIKAAEFARADTIFRTTTENPFLYIDNLNELIETHLHRGADLAVCENLPDGAFAEIIELSALKQSYREGEDRHRSAWISLYINENPHKFNIVKVLPPEEVRRPEIRLTVDYPEDLIVMRTIYEAFDGKMPIPISSIIRFLDEHPEVKAINANMNAGPGRIWR
jgi:spore coat polysaccharide biosynthesis protein SpsF